MHKSAHNVFEIKEDWIIRRTITLNNCQPEKKQAPLDENGSAWHFYASTFTIIHFHFLVKPTSKQVGRSSQWKLAHLTFSDLLILTPHHLWHDLGKSVGLVGFGIKQALRFFFLRWVWGWLSSFAELYWTWLSFHKENGVMNVWGLVMLVFFSSWWISSETYQAKKQWWQFWRQSPV